MGLKNLGRKLWNVTKENGRSFWDDVGKEFQPTDTDWTQVKQEFSNFGYRYRHAVGNTLRDWVQEESKKQGIDFSLLWGKDPEVQDAFRALELPYGSDLIQVKKKWRDMLKQTHPDRYMNDPKEHSRATKTTQSLTAAYHTILKASDEGRI